MLKRFLWVCCIVVPVSAGAGVVVDPGGLVESIVADPVRNAFYASLDTNEIVLVDTAGAVSQRVTVAGDPDALAVASDGSALYVALEDSHDVAVYTLPGLTFSTHYPLSATAMGPTGLVEKPGRLYAVSDDGLSIVDTTTGTELYFGQPPGGPAALFYRSVAALSPDGRRLFALDTGIVASLYVFDVSTDAPVYLGEDCCHGCIGSNGRQVTISPDGSRAYVVTGSEYHLQVLATTPLLHREAAVLTGPYPNAVVVSADGERLFVGYQDDEFAVARASDWLAFHVGPLQGRLAHRGLALSFDEATLAAVIQDQGFEPNRIELVDVASPVANRGGLRVRPLDAPTGVPVGWAYLDSTPNAGVPNYFEERAGYFGLAPLPAGAVQANLNAIGHAGQTFRTTVTAGAWTNLGDAYLPRTGTVPPPGDVCASPAAFIGGTTTVEVHGRGFLPEPGLAFTSLDPGIVVDSFEFVGWATMRATLSVDAAEPPGFFYATRVTNPDGQWQNGTVLLKGNLFADGFETGDALRWSTSAP